MTPMQQQGYSDQQAGMVNAALAEADTPEGREYRDGARARKRAEYDAIMRDGIEFAGPASDYLGGAETAPEASQTVKVQASLAGAGSGPGGAFAEPEPAAKKPRKAKPVDDTQASLL